MPRYQFAVWKPLTGSSGAYLGGPFKIVHHTTEGSTAEGAMEAFRKHRSDPHFTVDANGVFQHIDTSEAARALRNDAGGIETNRDSAIQIELVGFAHLPKNRDALTHLARLCRWLEEVHGVPRVWPAGPPLPAKSGRDPGGHNRDPQIWDTRGGHYGHCHVPENTHWDPAYSALETTFLMDARFDAKGDLQSPTLEASLVHVRAAGTDHRHPVSTMLDHAVVPLGPQTYIRDLSLTPYASLASEGAVATNKLPRRPVATKKVALSAVVPVAPTVLAKVNVGSLLSFVDGIPSQARDDVLYSVQLAQRAASGTHDRFTQTRAWYQTYIEVLENLGWAIDQFAFSLFDQSEGEFRMDQAALAIITAIATQNQLIVLQQSVAALSKLAEDDGTIRLFDFHSSMQGSGNFQLGVIQLSASGTLSMALGAFYFRTVDERRRFLFFKWGARQVNFWTAAQRMTLNTDFYARCRDEVIAKLDADAPKFIGDLILDSR